MKARALVALPLAALSILTAPTRPLAQGRATLLDNASVAVTRPEFAPGSREQVHTHPFPLLIVQITAGKPTVAEREMLRVGDHAGEVWFIPANTPHEIANRTDYPFAMLAIAIKPDRPAAPVAPPTEAPDGITRATLVDNADVRVVRVRFAPGSREPLHAHPNDLLTVQITPGRVEIVNGAERSTGDREVGFVQFLGRNLQHAFISADTKPFELLSISIK